MYLATIGAPHAEVEFSSSEVPQTTAFPNSFKETVISPALQFGKPIMLTSTVVVQTSVSPLASVAVHSMKVSPAL